MSTLFVTRRGQVVSFRDEAFSGGMPLGLTMDNWDGFPTLQAILTKVNGQSVGNFQVMHTLKRFIYVYVFGERVGELSISGLAFSEVCNREKSQTGIEDVNDYYKANCISETGKLITVTIGLNLLLRGFLVGFRHQAVDADQQLVQFDLSLLTIPSGLDRD